MKVIKINKISKKINNFVGNLLHFDFICFLLRRTIIINKSSIKIPFKVRWQFKKCKIIIDKNANSFFVGKRNIICNTSIIILKSSSFIIGSGNKIYDIMLQVLGSFEIGSENIIKNDSKASFLVDGRLLIKDRNRFNCTIWIRFGGTANIGSYNTINDNSEIRCDDEVFIGNYNQISMNNRIWDTNTHRIISDIEEYKRCIRERYPQWDEIEKPRTRKTFIGDCNWLGEYVFIKGSKIHDHCIIGTRSMIIDKDIPSQSIAFNEVENRIYQY